MKHFTYLLFLFVRKQKLKIHNIILFTFKRLSFLMLWTEVWCVLINLKGRWIVRRIWVIINIGIGVLRRFIASEWCEKSWISSRSKIRLFLFKTSFLLFCQNISISNIINFLYWINWFKSFFTFNSTLC